MKVVRVSAPDETRKITEFFAEPSTVGTVSGTVI